MPPVAHAAKPPSRAHHTSKSLLIRPHPSEPQFRTPPLTSYDQSTVLGMTDTDRRPRRPGFSSTALDTVAFSRALEALELARCTLQADHLRFFTSNHSSPIAATINTTMMLHGVDDADSSLGDGETTFASGSFDVCGGGLVSRA